MSRRNFGLVVLLAVSVAADLVQAAAAPASGASATAPVRAQASRGVELDRVVAVVNDGVVLESELDAQVREVTQRLTSQNVSLPPEAVMRSQVLEQLVLEEIQAQRAERAGISVSDEQVNAALEDIARRQQVPFAQLPEKLAETGYVYADFRASLRREIQRELLRSRDVVQRINISPRELDQYLEKQQKSVSPNAEYNVSHILVAVAQDAAPADMLAARQKAQGLAARIANGESFSQLAVTFSDSQTALDGGSLGWRKGPELPTFLADIVGRLKPGETSEVIQTPTGFHLVRLNEIRAGSGPQIIEQVHLRHILIKTNEVQDDPTVKQKLADMRQRILGGEDFAVLAKATSEDPGSAVQGGDLGWSKLDAYVGAFAQTAEGLQQNEISEPFKTDFGWHIVQMLGRRRFDNAANAAREQAFAQLRESRVDEATELWLQQLRDEAYVEMRL